MKKTPIFLISTFSTLLFSLIGHQSQVLLACDCRGETADSRGDIPYVISPRRTLVLGEQPKLQWNAVPGATRYTVQLLTGNRIIWQTEIERGERNFPANEVIYPGSPPLQSGVSYVLRVQSDDGTSSDQESISHRSFQLLSSDKRQFLQNAIAQLQNLSIPETQKALILADFYAGSELKAEAIALLEALVAKETKDPVIYRKLGNLYWQSQLATLAERYYLDAVALAKTIGDVEEQAQSAIALADVYIAIANNSEAIRWLTQARESYQKLGDLQRIQELDSRLARLRN